MATLSSGLPLRRRGEPRPGSGPVLVRLLFVFSIVLAACGAGAQASGGSQTASLPPLSQAPNPSRTPAGNHVAYAALGASETYGVGAMPVTKGYAYRLRDALHLDASSFAAVGIPGATLAQAYQNELGNALAIRPTVSTVFFGVNDIRDRVPVAQFASDLTDLVTTLRRGHSEVLVVGVPQLADLPAFRRLFPTAQLNALTEEWNTAIQQVSKQAGSGYLSLESFSQELLAHPELVATDGLHPSDVGHARLATIILAAMQADGYVPPPTP